MKKLLSIILILIFSLSLFSCASVSDEEAIEIVKDLVSRSEKLNEIYYGKGLSYDPESEVEGSGYFTVAEDAPYRTKSELISETRGVFSEEMAANIITVYFDGAESYDVPLYARYITGLDGYLTVKADYKNPVQSVYKYDYSTIKLTKNTRNKIKAEITTVDGSETVTVELVNEDNGYRIDSPTY